MSGTIGAYESSKSQEGTNKSNERNVKQTNRTNLLLQLASRGAPLSGKGVPAELRGREAAVLPYYMGDAEQRIGAGAVDMWDAIQKLYATPGVEIADYQRLLDTYAPALAQNDQLAADIASGRVGQEMLDESAPVFQSRVDAATTRKNAKMEALKATLNEIDTIQARKGFTGDSLGNRLLKSNARMNIASSGADDLSQANLANAIEKRAVQGDARSMRLNNISLPDALARAALERKGLPAATATRRFQTSLQPFQFFNLGPHTFNGVDTPIASAVPSALQIAAQGSAAAGNAALDYAMQRSLQKRAQSQTASYGGGWGTGAPAGTTTYGGSSYAPGAFDTYASGAGY